MKNRNSDPKNVTSKNSLKNLPGALKQKLWAFNFFSTAIDFAHMISPFFSLRGPVTTLPERAPNVRVLFDPTPSKRLIYRYFRIYRTRWHIRIEKKDTKVKILGNEDDLILRTQGQLSRALCVPIFLYTATSSYKSD